MFSFQHSFLLVLSNHLCITTTSAFKPKYDHYIDRFDCSHKIIQNINEVIVNREVQIKITHMKKILCRKVKKIMTHILPRSRNL